MSSQVLDNIRSMLHGISVALFDFDGVLANTEKYHALSYVEILKKYNVCFKVEDFKKYIGNPERDIYRKLEEKYGIDIDIPQEIEERTKYFLKLIDLDHLVPYQNILDILKFLKQEEKKVFIVSSQRPEVIESLLELWGIHCFIDGVYTVYGRIKTKREMLERYQELFCDQSNKIVVFEDFFATLDVAKRLSMKTVAIVHDFNGDVNLKADEVIDMR